MNSTIGVGDVLVGKYHVERVLGAGGMGVVVAAMHLHLGERVAIKLMLPEALKNKSLVERFLREGRAAAKIRSEHVARVYDVGVLETGAPYLVMEYLEGCDLRARLLEYGPLPVQEAVEYILQACEALGEAHAAGVVHRDIKPANLYVITRPDGSSAVKVIDFGISKIAAASSGGLEITKTVEAMGSPLFMSPEQMASARAVDARSDIWSLGVTLHNLLTGSYPFHAQTLPQLCNLILTGEPVPIRQERPDLPPALGAAILRCLRKDPSQRHASVAELAAALAEFAPLQARASAERVARVLRSAALRDRLPAPAASGFNLAIPTARSNNDDPTRPSPPSSRGSEPISERASEDIGNVGDRDSSQKALSGTVTPIRPIKADVPTSIAKRALEPGRLRAIVAVAAAFAIGMTAGLNVVLRRGAGASSPRALPAAEVAAAADAPRAAAIRSLVSAPEPHQDKPQLASSTAAVQGNSSATASPTPASSIITPSEPQKNPGRPTPKLKPARREKADFNDMD